MSTEQQECEAFEVLPEPTEFQVRTKPNWDTKVSWTEWKKCKPESAADFERAHILHDWLYQVRKLYTEQQVRALLAAPAQPERKPLTDEQIDAIAEGMPGGLDGFLKGWGWRQFARAIEAASTPNAHDACKRCGGAMGPGVVVEPHYNCSDEGTCSIAPGPATLTECRKCHSCGWSTT